MLTCMIGSSFKSINDTMGGFSMDLDKNFQLKVLGPWRFLLDKHILLADYDTVAPNYPCFTEQRNWENILDLDGTYCVFGNYKDVLITKMAGATITKVEISETNDLQLTFSNGVIFQTFYHCSKHIEIWWVNDLTARRRIVCCDKQGQLFYDTKYSYL